MQPAASLLILPTSTAQSAANSSEIIGVKDLNLNNSSSSTSYLSNNFSPSHSNNNNSIKSFILLSSPSITSPISQTAKAASNSNVKKQQPIKPKIKSISESQSTQQSHLVAKQLKLTIKNEQPIKQLKIVPKLLPATELDKQKESKVTTSNNNCSVTILANKSNQEFKKTTKTKKRSAQQDKLPPLPSLPSQPLVSDNDESGSGTASIKTKTKKQRSFKRIKRDLNSSTLSNLDPEISNLIKAISSNSAGKQKSSSSSYKESLAFFSSSRTSSFKSRVNSQSITSKTAFSSSLFDSIEYLSSSWTNIFKTGNDTDQESLNLFRQFHCADCLKSFQQKQKNPLQADTTKTSSVAGNYKLTPTPSDTSKLTSHFNNTKTIDNLSRVNSRLQMNTPPPPLQPIIDEAKNGLYHYFGQQNSQPTVQQQTGAHIQLTVNPRLLNENQQLKSNNHLNVNIGHEIAATSPFLASPYSPFHSSAQQNMQTNELDSDFKDDEENENDDDDDDDRTSQASLQQKRQSLSRKLALRRPKQELIERGILPASRISNLHYNRMKHLEKAKLQDILRTKIEKRPNRELLVQKNILPDSAPKAAPALQLKCNELKRARLADDLNEKLAKRPGPLELVESGILVSSDSTLTEAIKDGKLQYPRTSTLINSKHCPPGHPYHLEFGEQPASGATTAQDDLFNLDDSSLNYLNFNFNNLTDNDDSNASQTSNSTTKTNNTLASISSSATSFNVNTGNSIGLINMNPQINTSQSHQQQQLMQTNSDLLNFNDFSQLQSSNAPSPSSSTSTSLIKPSPSSSPYPNYDFLNNTVNSSVGPTKPSNSKSTSSAKQKSAKSFSSASSTTSSTSNSSKTNKLQRNNSNISAVSSLSSANGTTSNTVTAANSGSNLNINQANNGTKKLSQLIFHEYRGPNQKSSKTSISLKPNVKTNNSANNNSQPNNNANSLLNGAQTNTSEIFFDDSNDSANNNLNSAMMVDNLDSHSTHRNELNPHKIRMKQQKIFLKYNNSTNNNSKEENNWVDSNKAENSQMDLSLINQSSPQQQQPKHGNEINSVKSNDFMSQQQQPAPKQLITTSDPKLIAQTSANQQSQQLHHHLQPVTMNDLSPITNQSNQSIQLVPIGDIQMLLGPSNFLPIVSVAQLNSNNNVSVNPIEANKNANYSLTDNINKIQTSNVILPPPTPSPQPAISASSSSSASSQVKLINNNLNSSASNVYTNNDPNNNLSPLIISTRQSSTSASLSQSLQSIQSLSQFQQASPIKSSSSEIFQLPPNHILPQKTLATNLKINKDIDNNNKQDNKLSNIEDMSLNELKEECRRRKLLVTGNKQKLIERIKMSMNGSTSQLLQHSGIKSPDSGVNMDGSPSFITSEQSPCANSINKQRIGLVSNEQVKPVPNSNGNQNASNLDDFFNYLDIENLGTGDVNSKFDVDTNKPNQNLEAKYSNEAKINGKSDPISVKEQPDNITETAATLEISLKSSAELLKQLSSTGHIEHLHLLEKQMKESMQFIERLKSASNTPKLQTLEYPDLNSTHCESTNKLRTINSMPSNLRELEMQHQHHNQQTYNLNHNYQTTYDLHAATGNQMQQLNELNSKSNHLMKSNIPLAKNNYDMNGYHHYSNMSHSKLPVSNGTVKEESLERPFQFETMMKELNEKVTFTCNPPDDEDNSNETDSILMHDSKSKANIHQTSVGQFIQNANHVFHASSLPSIDSLIGQQQQTIQYKLGPINNLSYDEKMNIKELQQNNNINNNNAHHESNNQNGEMEWNESEFLQLCQDLDETNDHLYNGNISNKSGHNSIVANHHQHHHQNTPYSMINHHNQHHIQHNNLDKQHKNDPFMLGTTSTLSFNDDTTSILNFEMNQRIVHSEYNIQNNNGNNESGSKHDSMLKSCIFMENNSNNNVNIINGANNTNVTTNNNNNNNMMMPWEFDNEINQLANYLQSPTV